MGLCVIAGVNYCVLYDFGATHSFVSEACVKKLGLSVFELQCDLVVSTRASSMVRTLSLCARCPVEVEGCVYKVNLICLPLQELEVIFGMDLLFANYILIDYREKRLFFPNSKELELVSSQGVMKEIQDGAQCFIIFTHLEVEKKEGKFVILLVYEFEDVFLEEVPGLSPSREVEFSIDLVPVTDLVSMTPYRVAPTELVELQNQIEELLGKQFIWPSTSALRSTNVVGEEEGWEFTSVCGL